MNVLSHIVITSHEIETLVGILLIICLGLVIYAIATGQRLW